MKKVRVTMVDYMYPLSLHSAVKKVNELISGWLDFRFYDARDIEADLVDDNAFIQDLRDSDIVLLNVMGGDKVSRLICDTLSKTSNTVVVFVGGSSEIINLTRLGSFSLRMMSRMGMRRGKIDYGKILEMQERFEKLGKRLPIGLFKHAKNYALLLKYYQNPTFENYYSMLLLLLREYGKIKVNTTIPEPKVLPSMGIINFKTGEVFSTVADYLRSYEFRDRPLIGILYYGGHHHYESYPAAKLLTEKLESYGYGVIPVFSADLRYYLAIEKFFFHNGKPLIEVLVDLLWFRFAGGPIGGDHSLTINILSKLNVPVLHGIQLHSVNVNEWFKSKHGLPPVEMVTTVILPELDGRIEPTVTHGIEEKRVEGVKLEDYVAIEERVEKLARRVIGWVKLREKPNDQKRIAIVIYNYPPGEANLGKAEGLDVFESLSVILQALKSRGYDVTETPSGKELNEILISRGALNTGGWVHTSETMDKMIKVQNRLYKEWLNEIPKENVDAILNEWGPPPGRIMNYRDSFLIPGVIFGKIFVGVQPTRGVHENHSKLYHDKNLPPHHQYVAFYKWIKNEFKADAIIHLGTHGTLEFLPGKDVGLSGLCFPDLLIDDLPNIYVYHALNPSEASIAKRRSYALIINHGSPPLIISDLHGDLQEIERLLQEYFHAAQYGLEKASEISKKILDIARNYELGETVEEVYDKIEEYKRSLIPRGLHVIGRRLSNEEILDYLTFIARYDRGNIESVHKLILEADGLSYEEVLKNPHKRGSSGKTYAEILKETEAKAREMIERYIFKSEKSSYGKLNERLENSLSFLKNVYERITRSDEVGALINALEGNFIPPGPGGDFIRNPEIFPTGRNTYQLDPTGIPTETAMERGKVIAEECVRRFYESNGRYPRMLSLVLWGFETMKTGGETVAAIFHLLGVKPVWKGLYIRDLEVIPLSELKRPRIDVAVTICGIFRDTFYNIVELLDKAFRLVAELDEPEDLNYVKANVRRLSAKHGELAHYRIFGPPEGLYATSLTSLIESSTWKSEQELVNAYLESMKFAYGEKKRSIEAASLLETLLSNVDAVSQVRDTIEYEVTDLDHYYEFLGGLSKTVEEKSGKKPLVLIADTTREVIKVEDVKESVKRGIVTRVANPKWLDSMINHGYTGVAKIADRIEYMIGLSATIGKIEDWMWKKVAENTVFDKQRSEKMKNLNIFAYRKAIERFLEAIKRGYWQADKETFQRLREEYLRIEELLESEVR
ncbi:MAG: magnesium chelatase subunit H [Candidatus Bathyarchaeia archaeon]